MKAMMRSTQLWALPSTARFCVSVFAWFLFVLAAVEILSAAIPKRRQRKLNRLRFGPRRK